MDKKKTVIHILLWVGLYLFWIFVLQNRSFAFSRTVTVEFCYLFFIAANFYFNIAYNIPRFLYRQKYVLFGMMLLAGITVAALLRVPLASYLNLHYFMPGKLQPGFSVLFLKSFVNIFIWVICLVTGKLIIDRVKFQQYVETMKKEKSKSELDFLQAQFNPHFLFNSINSIYGHIDKKNVDARKMLLTFSDMLRYQLYECNTETIHIDKELNYIKNYIALQQSRMEESLIVKFNVANEVNGFKIAPLLFMAFIENSFKYVSNNDATENRVEISFAKLGDELVFRTYNTKEQRINSGIKHKGIGINNVKRRLELLYPEKYNLAINDQEENHEVILKLQLL
jgi:two-component system LytT family sensor kinase